MPLWHLRFNIIAFYLEKKDKNQNQACRRIRERSLKPWPSYERMKMRWTNMGHHITSYTATVLPAQPPYWKILFKLALFFQFYSVSARSSAPFRLHTSRIVWLFADDRMAKVDLFFLHLLLWAMYLHFSRDSTRKFCRRTWAAFLNWF